ncbi:PEGA domain-containing protein [Candidatus Parcubacteria bacterium]|nr:PEGA domain-containing protein [Candidatus Parcubacteria bacterium]
MKQSLTILGVSILVIFGGFFGYRKVIRPLFVTEKFALSVDIPFDQSATVFLDGKKLGTTPFYSEDIEAKEGVLLISSESATFEKKLTFTPGTRVAVHWDLGPSQDFQAGDIIWLEPSALGARVAVISEPAGADVAVDGDIVGKTPFSPGDIPPGEHRLEVTKEGYEKRSLRIRVMEDYKLNVSFRLYPIPLVENPTELSATGAAVRVFDLSQEDSTLFANPAAWVKGLIHWVQTRFSGASDRPEFDYFVDWQGKVYDHRGVPFSGLSETSVAEGQIGYLGRASDENLTDAAQIALENLLAAPPSLPGVGGVKVEILETGAGWLRVHSAPIPGTANEVARVDVGNLYPLIDEQPGWYKIELEDGVQGWIAATYGKKIELEESE